jgi:hypothetical protein
LEQNQSKYSSSDDLPRRMEISAAAKEKKEKKREEGF